MCRSASPDSGVNKDSVVGKFPWLHAFVSVSSAQVSTQLIQTVTLLYRAEIPQSHLRAIALHL
jgi:hypothetical protein